MKKKKGKWMALLLSTAMVLSCAACGSTDSGNDSVAANGEENEENAANHDEWEREFDKYIQDEEPVDLGGYEFKVVDFHENRWNPDEIKSPQDQLVCDIIEDVENTFNCKITFEAVSPDVIFETSQPEIMSGGKYADLIGTTMWAFGKMLGGGLVRDLNTVETLDLSQDCFNQNVSKMASFGNSTYAFGAAFGSHLTNHWIIFYNASIWQELGLPDPYDLVDNNEWTWSKLVEYAKLALRDNDGNGIVDSEADRWGITAPSGDLCTGMFLGMDGHYYKPNAEGKVRLGCLDAASADKIDFMYNFFQKDNILYKNENVGYLETFAAGKALFMAYGNGMFDQLKDMEDDFGVLPMPKWDGNQEEYQNPVDHNAPIFCITNTNQNTYEAGIIITALAKRYQAYEDLLFQDMEDIYWRFDRDSEMVDEYVRGHGAYDIVHILRTANSNFGVPCGALFDGCYNNMYSDIVSTIASMEDALSIMLDEFFANLSK